MTKTAVLPLLLALAGFTGCGSSTATSVTDAPVVKRDAKRVTARAQKCLATAQLTTSAGRKAVLTCIGVTPGHEKAALRCIQKKVVTDLTHTDRLATDISNCALS